MVSHLGSATARLLAAESRLWYGWYMQSRFFIGRGQCSQPNLSRVEVVDGHLYKAHVVSSDGAGRFMTAEAPTPLESGVQINEPKIENYLAIFFLNNRHNNNCNIKFILVSLKNI